jgi:hypothetical protein
MIRWAYAIHKDRFLWATGLLETMALEENKCSCGENADIITCEQGKEDHTFFYHTPRLFCSPCYMRSLNWGLSRNVYWKDNLADLFGPLASAI